MDQDMDMTNITPVNEEKKSTAETKVEAVYSSNVDWSKVKLISSDGQCFTVDYDCVIQSGTIKELLDSNPNWLENRTGVLEFPCIDAKILTKVVDYMLYKRTHANELVEEFFIEPEMALDMMLAADYLDL